MLFLQIFRIIIGAYKKLQYPKLVKFVVISE